MFYRLNTFEAGYCHETDTDIVYRWLRAIGPANRAMMSFFRFFDANESHDMINELQDLKAVQRGPVVREMGAIIESIYADECSHEVTFPSEELEALDGLCHLFGQVNDVDLADSLEPHQNALRGKSLQSLWFAEN